MSAEVQTARPIIAVVGPTTSGKSELGIALALRAGGEIINCDSVQVYREIEIEVAGSEGTARMRGPQWRSVLGLKENLFVVDREFDSRGRVTAFVFTGRGWGHGVGMCQVGAYGLARAGLPYDKILKSFYTGISVTKLY